MNCPYCNGAIELKVVPVFNGTPAARPNKRLCARCRRPIKRSDRWHWEGPATVHRDCKNPTCEPKTAAPAQEELEAAATCPHD